MPNLNLNHPDAQKAIKALNITVPVYRAEIKGNTITLWLYGRSEPVTWRKPSPRKRAPKKKEA